MNTHSTKPLEIDTFRCLCPYCLSELEIALEFAGVTAPCPGCSAPLTAPVQEVCPPKTVNKEHRLNEEIAPMPPNERIETPHIGSQIPSNEQIHNIENASPLRARPRPPRRSLLQEASPVPISTLSLLQAPNVQMSDFAPPQYRQPQGYHSVSKTQPDIPFEEITTRSLSASRDHLPDTQQSSRMLHKKELEGCIKMLEACILKLESQTS